MPIKHVHLCVPTFPRRTPERVLDGMLDVARLFGARATATIVLLERPLPGAVAGRYLDLFAVVETQNRASLENMRHARAHLAARAAELGLACESAIVATAAHGDAAPALLIEPMRCSDLAITPVVGAADGQPRFLESLIFEAGRPLLVLPREGTRPVAFDDIVVGWDHGRAAARALGDAMAFLRRARRVRVVTVDEPAKPGNAGALARLGRHLESHGVAATFEAIESAWQPVGERLMEHAVTSGAGLLVVGAFGHGRARDFVLGSATRSLLADPALPVLLSH